MVGTKAFGFCVENYHDALAYLDELSVVAQTYVT